jgi:hypothetical protein
MNTETMLSLLRRKPFEPFEVRMSPGDTFKVLQPDMALLLKSSLIFGSRQSDRVDFYSLRDIDAAREWPRALILSRAAAPAPLRGRSR